MSTNNPESSTLVHSFPRGEKDEIQMALTQYKGRFYIDLRIWFQSPENGQLLPSKKGVSFSTEKLINLKEGIQRLEEACRKNKPEATPPKPVAQQQYQKRQPTAWAERKNS